MKRLLLLLLAAAGFLLVQQSGASAADFTVNSNGDAVDANVADGVCATSGGVCTLRAAVMQAENISGKDTVTIPAMTISLQSQITITKSIAIKGAGARSTVITGTPGHILFKVEGGDNEISDLAFSGASSATGGGGLAVQQTANAATTLARVRVVNNTITGAGSVFGPVYLFAGDLTVQDSEISGNSTSSSSGNAYGGGIYVQGAGSSLTVVNSTIANNNLAVAGVGGDSAWGGGIFLNNGAMTVRNSTLMGNRSINNGSLSASGGNLYLAGGGSRVVENSIIAGGVASFAKYANCSGTATFVGLTIVSDDTCGAAGSGRLIKDPQLGALADNGGPTNTLVPALGSPAIDAAPNCVPAADQRGQSRPIGAACELGAVELGADMSVTQTVSNATPTDGSDVVLTSTVTNRGLDDAADSAVTVAVAGAKQVATATTNQGTCAINGGTVTCQLGVAKRDTPVTILIVARAPVFGPMTSVATVTSALPDPVAANNSATVTANVASPVKTAPSVPCATLITGTRKADRLTGASDGDRINGKAGNDRLKGQAGDDCLLGKAGNDRLVGGTGKDTFTGGPGRDVIKAKDGARDVVRCGAGRDGVVADAKDKVAKDCERVRRR